MKTLIPIIFLLILAGTVNAQENSKSLKLGYVTPRKAAAATVRTDTVKVVMLVCDTDNDSSGIVFWLAGYEIKEYSTRVASLKSESDDSYNEELMVNKKYLDHHKLPLKSAVIVWDSKQIEK
jgi:hypothetical protein